MISQVRPQRRRNVVGVSVAGGWIVAWLQASLGLSAHAVAAGCLPSTRSLALLLPALALGAHTLARLLGTVPRSVALLAGQCLVHAMLAAAAGCAAGAGGAHATAGAGAFGHVGVMALAHSAALVVCVGAIARVDAALQSAARGGLRVVGRVLRAVALLVRRGQPVLLPLLLRPTSYDVRQVTGSPAFPRTPRAPPQHRAALAL